MFMKPIRSCLLLGLVFAVELFCPAIARGRVFPNICLQPPPRSEGICTVEIEGWWFDPRSNDCQMYVVGGCRSSPGQSFGSRQDCLATCVHLTRRIQDLRVNE